MLPPATTRSLTEKRRSRPVRVAYALKDWIVERGLNPDDRLPSEPELIARFGMSKGTIREAIRLLEAQGLVKTRTGPGGGAFVNAPSESRTQALLSNYFYFRDLSIEDIYQLRRVLEPELAADLAGKLSEHDLQRLEATMNQFDAPACNAEEERLQHIASLEFHKVLGEFTDNAMLGFAVRFLANVLIELTVYRRLFNPPNPEIYELGQTCQGQLIDALREGDAHKAREVSAYHMGKAQNLMQKQEAIVQSRFMSDGD